MNIRDLMSKRVVTVAAEAALPQAAALMRDENVGVLPVERHGALVGMITDRDITIHAVAKGDIQVPVSAVMTPIPVTIGPQALVAEAIYTMLHYNVRRLPVIDRDRLVGMVSLEDLVEAGNDQELLSALRGFHQQTRHG